MQDQRLEWLKTKMDDLFAKKALLEADGKDFNTGIQNGREYRNPRICEKLIEAFDIKQYGTNLPKHIFDPDGWKKQPDAFYGSKMYHEMKERRDDSKSHDHRHRHSHSHHHHHHHSN
jgi:hypothetical protein